MAPIPFCALSHLIYTGDPSTFLISDGAVLLIVLWLSANGTRALPADARYRAVDCLEPSLLFPPFLPQSDKVLALGGVLSPFKQTVAINEAEVAESSLEVLALHLSPHTSCCPKPYCST